MKKDRNKDRYDRFQKRDYLIDIRNCIRYNLSMESIIKIRLAQDPPDFLTMEALIQHMLRYDSYKTSDKQWHLMQMMTYILKSDTTQEDLSIYFRIFRDSEKEDDEFTLIRTNDVLS